jgi:Tol biopolymer transport system component
MRNAIPCVRWRHTLFLLIMSPLLQGGFGDCTPDPTTPSTPAERTPSRIAYARQYQEIVDLTARDTDGITHSPLIQTDGDDEDPAFAPVKIEGVIYAAFASDLDGDWDIYVVPVTSGVEDAIKLTSNDVDDGSPSFDPSGRIVFSSERSGNWDIWVMEFDGSNAAQLTSFDSDEQDPAFSPDGTKIIFESEHIGDQKDIWIMDADGGNMMPLTTNSAKDSDPAWSQDGTKIAFSSDRHGSHDLFMMNPDGTEMTRLTDWDDRESDPSWSPDGTKIAFETDHAGDWEIYILELGDPITFSNFSNRPEHDDWDPAWSPGYF